MHKSRIAAAPAASFPPATTRADRPTRSRLPVLSIPERSPSTPSVANTVPMMKSRTEIALAKP